uniref:Z67r protein n=1 Tax=Vibrio cholerae TaxID=666 RepID=O87072_VIBCL|nr:z67r [Vibrio cholerae]
MKGTISSAVRAILRMPPKITKAVSNTIPIPISMGSKPKAVFIAWVIELACTALNTKPNAMIRKMENSTPIQRIPRAFSM